MTEMPSNNFFSFESGFLFVSLFSLFSMIRERFYESTVIVGTYSYKLTLLVSDPKLLDFKESSELLLLVQPSSLYSSITYILFSSLAPYPIEPLKSVIFCYDYEDFTDFVGVFLLFYIISLFLKVGCLQKAFELFDCLVRVSIGSFFTSSLFWN
jgi:hypothetical protein